MKRRLFLSLLAVAGALGIALFAFQDRSDRRESIASSASEPRKPVAREDSFAQVSTRPESGPTSKVANQQRVERPMTGPTPITAANVERVNRFAEEIAVDSRHLAELWTRINSESVDEAWAEPLSRQLADRFRAVGLSQTGLQISEPRCFTSLCVVMANGGLSTEDADANWQRLLYTVAEEPWFQENFKDLSTTMRAEQKGTMYVTYLLRRGYEW